jgi:hypothetical protein
MRGAWDVEGRWGSWRSRVPRATVGGLAVEGLVMGAARGRLELGGVESVRERLRPC